MRIIEDVVGDIKSFFEGFMPLFEWFIASVSQHPFEWTIIAMIMIGTDFVKRFWKLAVGLTAVLGILFLVFCVGSLIEAFFPGLLLNAGLKALFWFVALIVVTYVGFGVVMGLIVEAIDLCKAVYKNCKANRENFYKDLENSNNNLEKE